MASLKMAKTDLNMAKLAGVVICDFLVALDAGFVRGSACSWNGLFVDDVAMAVNTSEFELLDVKPVGDSYVVGDLFFFDLDPFVTIDAIVVDEFVFC